VAYGELDAARRAELISQAFPCWGDLEQVSPRVRTVSRCGEDAREEFMDN
jgi:hypothetical protein